MAIAYPPRAEIVYPDSDGQPMADNTLQFEWITTLKFGIEALFGEEAEVFVAGDLLWYPVEGDNSTRFAPDVLVAFGRPKGYRGCYRQWEEGGIAPQVVFEILSPSNRAGEMIRKYRFYDRYGVEEYFLFDPDKNAMDMWIRSPETNELTPVPPSLTLTSPRLRLRFELSSGEMVVYRPDGERFKTYQELMGERNLAREWAETERKRAETERERADQAEATAARLAARLRELGIEPDAE